MPGTTIGTSMNYGYPGTYSRNDPALKVSNRVVTPTDTVNLNFGAPAVLIQNATGGYHSDVAGFIAGGGTFSFAPNGTVAFAGFAVREVKSFETYTGATIAYYAPATPSDVLERGNVSIVLKNPQASSVVAGGPVYIRVSTNGTYPSAAVGDIEPAADGAHTVQLTNCMITTGLVDANNVCEITLLTANVP